MADGMLRERKALGNVCGWFVFRDVETVWVLIFFSGNVDNR